MPLSGRNERNAKGQYLPGVSGNPGGEPGWIRKRFTADFLTAFHDHFQREGRRVIAKVAKQQPAAYLRCLTMLVPKEMKVETSGGIKAMTDEQLDDALAALRQLIADRAAAAANVIEGTAEAVALPVPEAQSPEATPQSKPKTQVQSPDEGGRHGGRPEGAQAEDAQGPLDCEHLISQFLAVGCRDRDGSRFSLGRGV